LGGILDTPGGEAGGEAGPGPGGAGPAPADGGVAAAAVAAAPVEAAPAAPAGPTPVVPAARRRASELGVDLAAVAGTGPNGLVRVGDVEAAATAPATPAAAPAATAAAPAATAAAPAATAGTAAAPAAPAAAPVGAVDSREHPPSGSATLPLRGAEPGAGSVQAAHAAAAPAPAMAEAGDVEEIPLSSMRRVVARRLVESMQSTPHFYLTTNVDAEALLGFRAELNQQLAAGGEDLKVSVNDLIVKACAALLRANPALNVSFAGDKLLVHRRVNVGIAVAVDGGLLVPVVRDADQKSLTQVTREARELIGRARDGKLAGDDVGGGTFTVSNLGMFGVEQFTAVINPPEAAILAVGAALPEPVATDDGVAVHRRMRLTLSIDHRALDGATGAAFLAQLKDVLEQPLRIVA
ncbi:MAG TPA: dihydrolipoamide acetyltransferase family protein, partial [Actinomycetota bacterium]|nr:dihydrolipoamide acetyltransferase family protein [Actinomycetota bacterium]